MERRTKKLWMAGLLTAAMVCMVSCGTTEDASTEGAAASPAVADQAGADVNGGAAAEETVEADVPEQTEEAAETEETAEEAPVQEIDYEAEIRDHYTAKKEYEELIRALLLGNLEAAQYIELAEEGEAADYRKMFTDAVVGDVIDDAVVSEGIKSAIDGVCEQKTMDEIVQETANGLWESAQEEAEAAIQDALNSALTGTKDLPLIQTVDWVDAFVHVDDTPVGLLNGMVELQKADVEAMTALLSQESFHYGDLLYLSALYKRVCSRQNEIIVAGGNAQKMEQEITLDELIEKWNHENSMILALDALREDGGYEISSECKQDAFHFRNFNVQGLQACYDVAGYKTLQKDRNRGEILSQKLMGDVLGTMASEGVDDLAETIQQEKISFYRELEGSLADSYLEVCRAKNYFDILYGAELKEVVETEERSAANEDQIYEAISALLNAVSRYAFDLKTAALLWENSLSDNETNYIGTLKYQLEQCYTLLDEGMELGMLPAGYTGEEQEARYVSIMDSYIAYLRKGLNSVLLLNEPLCSGSSTVTAYGVGDFNVYYRGLDSNPFMFAEKRLKVNYQGERYLWIYSKEGDPVYIQEGHATVYVMDNAVIKAYSPSGEDMTMDNVALQLYNNAKQIRSDFLSGNLAHGYEKYVF